MANYSLTRKAVEDLLGIWNYSYDNWPEKQADLFYQMLLNNCQAIAEDRVTGKNYEGIFRNIFGIRAGSHIIFYRKVATN
jgi:toxin ParE1/3/4